MKSLKAIQREIEGFIRTKVPVIEKLSKAAEKIQRACEQMDRSWSGSYAGYHGRLYFRDFEAPPLELQFSPEWGGIQGIPEGWTERSPEDVKSALEQLIGTKFSFDEIESMSSTLAEQCEDFRAELLDEISGTELSHTNIERNLELLSELKDCKFGYSKDDFVRKQIPKTLVSRDSSAVLQGVCIPSHVYFGGIGFEAGSKGKAVRTFLKLLERLSRWIERIESEPSQPKGVSSVLGNLHPEIFAKCHRLYQTGAFAEAVEKSFKVVKDRLRQLTGYESRSDAFGKTKLRIDGASAANVDEDFNRAVKFLTMAIDCFRNEKSHTSDAKIDDPVRAFEYLTLSSLALNLLEKARIVV